jgi:hypothetical protein
MKKQLLLGSALLAAISAFPQNGRIKAKPVGIANMADKIAAKFAMDVESNATTKLSQPIGPVQNNYTAESAESAVSMPPSTINWKLLTGSMNIYGMLVSGTRPLNYNASLNAVSFVHRKGASYTAAPTSNSGAIVAEISSDWGTTWDSTCIWSSGTDLGRYPQGGIYNPAGNTNISNAYVVGMGPTTDGSNWTGDFYASKKLGTYSNLASATPNAQQLLSINGATYSATQGKHGWSRQGFSSTNDGVVRSLALIQDDQQGLSTMRGLSVVKGTFNAGVFNWTTDSIIPPVYTKSDGTKYLNPAPQMVWDQAGVVGYVVCLGAKAGATLSNKGAYQPMVYKTTNSGLSWAPIAGIDFNSTAMAPLLDHIGATNANTNIAIPFFNDWDCTIDAGGKLHIGAVFNTGASPHIDSLSYFAQYSNQGETYKWSHTPGARPYLYDFISDGSSAFIVKTIDSLSSEACGTATGDSGFNDNPWDPTGTSGSKTDNVDSRIQMGRTPDGQYVTFSWSESDTNATPTARKYNSLPNLKARCMAIGSGTNMYQVSPTEINVTKVLPANGTNNPNVTSRATLNYMSQTTGSASVVTSANGYTVDIYTPMTVTNSNPFAQLTNNTTWYQNGKLSYSFSGATATVSGVSENALNSTSNSVIYPNPASNNAVLAIDLKDNSNVEVSVLNAIGQLVKANKAQGQVGQNTINIDLSGLSTGIYMVNVKVGSATSTKKLIVQ